MPVILIWSPVLTPLVFVNFVLSPVVKNKLVTPCVILSELVIVFCLAFNAVCVAVDIGLFKSLVLSTLPSPTSVFVILIFPPPKIDCPSIVFMLVPLIRVGCTAKSPLPKIELEFNVLMFVPLTKVSCFEPIIFAPVTDFVT